MTITVPERPVTSMRTRRVLFADEVSVTTNVGGTGTATTGRIDGIIHKVEYIPVSSGIAAGTLTIKTTTDVESIDSITMGATNQFRYPRAAVTGSAAGDNKWCNFVIADTITAACTGATASKTFTVRIYYE